MAGDPTQSENGPRLPRISVAAIAPVTTLAGFALYGIGWLFAEQFYSRLGLTPEEAGVGFGWIVIRVAVLLVLGFTFTFFGVNLLGLSDWNRRPDERYWTVLGLVGAAGLAIISSPGPIRAYVGVLVALVGLQIYTELSPKPRPVPRQIQRLAAGLLCLSLVIVMATYGAHALADRVRAGKGYSIFGVVQFSPVLVKARPGATLPRGLDNSCPILVGQANGVLYLQHGPERLANGQRLPPGAWRIPSSTVFIETGLTNCDREARRLRA